MRRLFGKKDEKKAAPNPYAEQPATNDAYLNQPAPQGNQYAQTSPQPGRQGLPTGPRSGLPNGPRQGLPNGPRSGASLQSSSVSDDYTKSPPPQYTQSPSLDSRSPQPGARYGNEKFGASGGYGGSRYDHSPNPASASSAPQRPGGYGGLGDPEERLWGDRYADRAAAAPTRQNAGWNPALHGDNQPTASDNSHNDYGDYGEQRELTEDELADQQKQRIVQELHDTNSTLDRSLSMAYQALEIQEMQNQSLLQQNDTLAHAERSLNKAAVQTRIGLEKTKDLKSAQGWISMRPGGKKLDAAEEESLEQQRQEAAEREELRKWEYNNKKTLGRGGPKPRELGAATGAKPRNKNFEFEDDSGEQAALNDNIEGNIDKLAMVVNQINHNAHTTSEILERSNVQIDRITAKSERTRDDVLRNEMKLHRAVR